MYLYHIFQAVDKELVDKLLSLNSYPENIEVLQRLFSIKEELKDSDVTRGMKICNN